MGKIDHYRAVSAWRAPRHTSRKPARPEHCASFFLALTFDGRTIDVRCASDVDDDATRTAGPLRGTPRWETLRTASIHAGPADVVRSLTKGAP